MLIDIFSFAHNVFRSLLQCLYQSAICGKGLSLQTCGYQFTYFSYSVFRNRHFLTDYRHQQFPKFSDSIKIIFLSFRTHTQKKIFSVRILRGITVSLIIMNLVRSIVLMKSYMSLKMGHFMSKTRSNVRKTLHTL